MSISKVLPFAPTTSNAQAATYLFSVCLFSISFLVFLNSSISFVITDSIGRTTGVGELVGTLGFVDELVALIACPIWGIASDRLGVRMVCVLGYAIVGISLFLFVQARNVYPQLLLARLLFSVGGAATATMVTAMLPTMTGTSENTSNDCDASTGASSGAVRSLVVSSDSQTIITPEDRSGRKTEKHPQTRSSPPRLAGLVGFFTGCGALVALLLFLPLPARLSHLKEMTQAQAIADSYYVVGGIALVISCTCFFGLRGLKDEDYKGWGLLFGKTASTSPRNDAGPASSASFLPYWKLLTDSILLGLKDANIGLGYLGGFVARASSVGISLFIPLYINEYYIRHGFCHGSPDDPSFELKKECRTAYLLAAELTGVSQLVALLCAPLFGYLSDRYRRFNIPLLVASVFGVVGYTAFAQLRSPEPNNVHGRGGSPMVFLLVALVGISQIGAIVCSLGLLGRGVLGDEGGYNLSSQLRHTPSLSQCPGVVAGETAPLLAPGTGASRSASRAHLKGSIAGVYSLSGGAAILLLTKLGGFLFDTLDMGAPFYMMAVFNAILLVTGIGAGAYREIRTRMVDPDP